MSFTTLALTGTVKDASQAAIAGAVVNLQLNAAITDGTTEIPATIITATADTNGNINFPAIVANDDTTTSPTGSFYTVTIFSGDEIIDYFGVTIAHAHAPSFDLFAFARVNTASLPALTYGVFTFNGRPGAVTLQTSDVLGVNGGVARSTDDTDSLPTPTGVGLEFIVTGGGSPQLQDIHFNGTSL